MYEFRLRAATPAGVPLGETEHFLDLACSAEVNAPGFLLVQLSPGWSVLPQLENNGRLMLDWRDQDLGMDWTPFFHGILRLEELFLGATETVDLGAVGLNWLLNTRVNGWPADTANRTAWTTSTTAEDVMKGLITHNMTAAATVGNGRIRTATGWPANVMTIGAGSGRGNVVTPWFNAHVGLLEEFQKLAAVGGGDFDFTFSGSGYQFQFYPGQRGADRSADVVFSVEFGNMADVTHTVDRREEANAAIVGGQGEKELRKFAVVTGPDYNANNEIEMFVAATDVPYEFDAGLTQRGKEKLQAHRALVEYGFRLLQTRMTRLGRDYFVGDKVSVVNPLTRETEIRKVAVAELSFDSDGNPNVEVLAIRPPVP